MDSRSPQPRRRPDHIRTLGTTAGARPRRGHARRRHRKARGHRRGGRRRRRAHQSGRCAWNPPVSGRREGDQGRGPNHPSRPHRRTRPPARLPGADVPAVRHHDDRRHPQRHRLEHRAAGGVEERTDEGAPSVRVGRARHGSARRADEGRQLRSHRRRSPRLRPHAQGRRRRSRQGGLDHHRRSTARGDRGSKRGRAACARAHAEHPKGRRDGHEAHGAHGHHGACAPRTGRQGPAAGRDDRPRPPWIRSCFRRSSTTSSSRAST